MSLNFIELPNHTTKHQMTVRMWRAEPKPEDIMQIICMRASDLELLRIGKVNFIGETRPTQGVLEEITDVYLCSWIFKDASGAQRVRPLVGNYHGGFASHREAVQLCNDVWRHRWRYRKPRPQIVRAAFAPPANELN
jgi:hypothetical protein